MVDCYYTLLIFIFFSAPYIRARQGDWSGQVQIDIHLCLVAVIGVKRPVKSHWERGNRERLTEDSCGLDDLENDLIFH